MPAWCVCCGNELEDDNKIAYINVNYSQPGEKEQVEMTAVACIPCGEESKTPAGFYATELLINTRITRLNDPDRVWTP